MLIKKAVWGCIMRVLMVSSSFLPKIDGSVRVVFDLSRKLAERGHEVYLLTRRFRGTPPFERIEGVNVVRVGPAKTSTLNRALLFLNQTTRLAELLKKLRFDVIHAHGCVPALVGAVGGLLADIPLIVTFHGHQAIWPKPLRWKRPATLKLQLWLERFILRRADVVVAQSTKIKRLFQALYGPWIGRKVRIIPNGVDLSLFNAPSGNVKENRGIPTILSVGTLSRIKGFDSLIQAVSIISQRRRVRLVIVGGGPQRASLERLAASLGVKGQITFTGWLSSRELYKYYRVADVVVLPTHAEFFNLTLLEAMAMAKPVVSTRVMGPTEIILNGENGLLVEPNNPKQLAEAILSIVANEETARRMGRAGRRLVEERYNLEVVVSQYEEVYRLAGFGEA